MASDSFLTVVGETASGKSRLALELAQKFNGEIINADASAIRREANIGTAKPSLEDMRLVRHHLIDIIGPDDKFTAAQFKQAARATLEDITARGKLPILVGGSGLYIDSILYDYSFKGKGEAADRQAMISNVMVIGISTGREELKQRIIQRVDSMIQAGLEAEVQALVDRYGWECEALRSIGYSEWSGYLQGAQTISETRQRIIHDTLGLAKRQRTWFKRNKSIHWFDTPVNMAEVVDCVTTFLSK